jgi:crossover junction endodeoxyribonuclease RuvC
VRILGIDPGSRLCGYAVVEADAPEQGGRLRYVECGVLEARAASPIEARLGEMAVGLDEILGELNPEQVAVEDIFAAVNVRSALALGQARGVVLAICGRAGLPVYGYAPSVIKQAVTGRGRAAKPQVAHMVRALLGLRREPRADAADALAVAIAHANLRKDLRPPRAAAARRRA